MNIIGSRYVKGFYISLGLYGAVVLGVVICLQYSGNKIATVYAPLIDAAMEIKLEISQSRLQYQDTYLATNPDYILSIGKLDRHIHNAKWYADAMLTGGKNRQGEFVSTDNARLRNQIIGVKQILLELDNKLHEAMIEQDNIIYNDRFKKQLIKAHRVIMHEVDQIETTLQNSMLKEKNNFTRMDGVVIILLAGAFILAFYIRLHKEGSKSISALRKLTMLDSLTGVYNRRYLDENIQLLWKQMARTSSALSLIMCDIDFFKKYNDAFGHVQGDVCLAHVARIIESALVRETDFVARYGGEEFCIVLPATDYDGAMTVMQNIHDLLRQQKIPHSASQVSEYVTVSAGVATNHPDNPVYDTSELMQLADKALYHAKLNGRNRTFFHSDDMHTHLVACCAS